ncbi:preprotein translocase subunit SecG [Treponema sp.]|uniref:preprotein translocase subunit SecG n=1 Tax=Treponema sp. TaxID=166 RepID=UPI003F0112F0
MAVLKTILLIAFVIICFLLILLVLVQNEENNGMGSAFGGGQSTAFGARSASVLAKTTGVLVALFFVTTFGILLLNKAPEKEDLSSTVKELQGEQSSSENSGNWLQEEINTSE